MNRVDSKLIWGLLLVAGGTFFLLQSVGLFAGLTSLFVVAAFGAAGLAFLYLFINSFESRWWAALPSMALLGLAGTIFLSDFGFGPFGDLAGAFFLASLGTGFALVLLVRPDYWWAIIPGGVLFTVAAVAGIDEVGRGYLDSGALFFLGLGMTFLMVARWPYGSERDLRWAYIPAGLLMGMGILIGTPIVAWAGSLWPWALIVGGIYLMMRRRTLTRN